MFTEITRQVYLPSHAVLTDELAISKRASCQQEEEDWEEEEENEEEDDWEEEEEERERESILSNALLVISNLENQFRERRLAGLGVK